MENIRIPRRGEEFRLFANVCRNGSQLSHEHPFKEEIVDFRSLGFSTDAEYYDDSSLGEITLFTIKTDVLQIVKFLDKKIVVAKQGSTEEITITETLLDKYFSSVITIHPTSKLQTANRKQQTANVKSK